MKYLLTGIVLGGKNMGIFNYNSESNTLDANTPDGASGREIATAKWVKDKINAHSPTGNCSTGQTSSTSTSTSSTDTTRAA
jgi:hypothetical protein